LARSETVARMLELAAEIQTRRAQLNKGAGDRDQLVCKIDLRFRAIERLTENHAMGHRNGPGSTRVTKRTIDAGIGTELPGISFAGLSGQREQVRQVTVLNGGMDRQGRVRKRLPIAQAKRSRKFSLHGGALKAAVLNRDPRPGCGNIRAQVVELALRDAKSVRHQMPRNSWSG
jgi:hypothetical protein